MYSKYIKKKKSKKNHNHIIEIIKTKMQQSFDCFSKLFIIKNLLLYRKKSTKRRPCSKFKKKMNFFNMHVIYSLRNIPTEPSSEACPNSRLSRTVLKDFNLGPCEEPNLAFNKRTQKRFRQRPCFIVFALKSIVGAWRRIIWSLITISPSATKSSVL